MKKALAKVPQKLLFPLAFVLHRVAFDFSHLVCMFYNQQYRQIYFALPDFFSLCGCVNAPTPTKSEILPFIYEREDLGLSTTL